MTGRGRGSRTRLLGVVALLLGTLTTAGIGAGWWWTDLRARQSAHRLADQAIGSWSAGPSPAGSPAAGSSTGQDAGYPDDGLGGSVIAVVRAARLGADWRMPIQRGTGAQVLRRGLGLYAGSPPPGAAGNLAVAGHRTTWGAPLKHLDRFRAGDVITLWSPAGRFDYRVVGTGVTDPGDVSVIQPATAGSAAMLTLTTCHPEFSARERLYLHAVLIDSAKNG